MSLAAYQEILCRMVASPDLRDRFMAHPEDFSRDYALTPLEFTRLRAVAAQPGMRVNTAIHRANRLAPLYETLPFTCFLLNEQLRETLDRYWHRNPSENLQLDIECARFATYLKGELHAGRVRNEYLEEILEFEQACAELRFRQPPLLRVIHFRHNPEHLLPALAELQLPATAPGTGHYRLAIDCRKGDAAFYLVSAEAAAALT